MARLLSGKPCEVTFYDRISDSRITLYYRLPTTKERVGYSNSLVTRKGRKIVNTQGEARQKYGASILLGFKEGDFTKEVDGKEVPISSDSKSELYEPTWKEMIKETSSDITEDLAVHVFEASLLVDEVDEDEDEEAEGESGGNP